MSGCLVPLLHSRTAPKAKMAFQEQFDDAMFGSQHDRSGSPKRQRPSPEGANDEDDALIRKVFGSNLPAKIFTEVKGVVKKFATAIGKLSRAVTRQRKAQQDLGELKEGKYPPGVRPYIPGTFVGLQSPLGLASEDDYVVEVVLPRGITRHEAMAKVHLAAATFYKHVDLELLEDYVKELKAQTDYEAFISEACLPASRHHTALQSLGITLPPGLEAPTRVTKEKALELYMGVVNKLAENKVQQKTEEDKRALQKQKLKEAIENANPRDLFDQAVRQVLRDSPPASSSQVDYVLANLGAPVEECFRDDTAGKSKGKGGGEKTRRFTKKELALRKTRTPQEPQLQQKNGQSQGGGPGYNTQKNAWTSGKGQSKGKGKSQIGGKGKSGKGSKGGKGTKGAHKGQNPGQSWW